MHLYLEILISLVGLYILFSIVNSAIVESIAQLVNSRGNYLKNKLKAFFGKELLDKFYNKNLVKAYSNYRNPAFIDKSIFSQSLLEVLLSLKNDSDPLETDKDIVRLLPNSLKDSFQYILKKAQTQGENKLQYVQEEIEKLYDAYMEKIAAWYKAYVRILLAIAGFFFASLFNIDSINMYHILSQDDTLRVKQVQFSTLLLERKEDIELNKERIQQILVESGIDSIPNQDFFDKILNAIVLKENEKPLVSSKSLGIGWLKTNAKGIWGYLLTGIALSLGSTFWFSLLKKLLLK